MNEPIKLYGPDVIASDLPPAENHELAEALLSRLPFQDRAVLLSDMVALCFFWMRHGSKREEISACDFLNALQRSAVRLSTPPNPSANQT